MTSVKPATRNAYCIALQPICDSQLSHVADELLYRASSGAVSAVIDDPVMATARACNAAFYETGIEALCGSRKLFFNAPRDWLLKPDLLPPDVEQVVIEVLENVEGDPEVMQALYEVKARGYTLALDDFVLTPQTRPLLDIADIIKLDMLEQPPKAGELDIYKAKGIRLLAEKVEDRESFETCRDMGFSLFQGYFYAHPTVKGSAAVNRGRNQGAQLQLLGELQKPDVDFDVLEKLLAQDPLLCIRLLRMINSVRYQRLHEIDSLRQAMLLLGLKRLRALVMSLVLANDDPFNMLMLPEMLTRAAMCERLAKDYHQSPESAFMTGLLSMASLMFNQNLEEFCKQMPLSSQVKSALMGQGGQLGKILKLVMAYEAASLNTLNDQAITKLNHYYLESRSWASETLVGLESI
ncbi:diguanylate phosphodiesterase [Nitrincola sp. A-D6]|uniref:EAL and HDOD domain-containing protein n=1 Tax=Nitrincola sp. A-D6 TaxID=1545442 RepID=UPI00051F9E5D|nr:HDOD domain-containing protein [Nitrincola sp. A-D6]KGK42217.1 diguanylate phosphodiesterase [Nitrincola sp. A-D6]